MTTRANMIEAIQRAGGIDAAKASSVLSAYKKAGAVKSTVRGLSVTHGAFLDRPVILRALASTVSHAVGSECPECGSRDTEDNGGTEYRCVSCDHRWGIDSGERYGF